MAYQLFKISSRNPNPNGACLCSTTRSEDCTPPYAIFYGQEMDDRRAPHVVACEGCLLAACRKMATEEALPAGAPENQLKPAAKKPARRSTKDVPKI